MRPSQRPWLLLAGLLFWAAQLAPPARAQLVNRAVWLGREREGFRRDYSQDAEYFLDRASYVDAPPWWPVESDPFGDRVRIAGGSVTSRDLTLEASTQLGVELGEGFTFRAQHLASENQTTRYQRFAVGLDKTLGASSALVLQLEGEADKEFADASFGLELGRSERSAHRFLFTLVDWSEGKSSEFEYPTSPLGLMLAGYREAEDGLAFSYDLSTQLPFEERDLEDGTELELSRTIGIFELRAPLAARDALVLSFDGEWTDKERRPLDPASAERETADVERSRLRLEWWRSHADGVESGLGLWLQGLDEDYVRPNDTAETRRVRRRELGLTGRLRLPLDDAWSLEPYVLALAVDLDDRTGGLASEDFDGFQGKLGAPILHRFSGSAFLRIDLSLQLDELAFGGGGVQLSASF